MQEGGIIPPLRRVGFMPTALYHSGTPILHFRLEDNRLWSRTKETVNGYAHIMMSVAILGKAANRLP